MTESTRPIRRIALGGLAGVVVTLSLATIGHAQFFDQWGPAVSVDPGAPRPLGPNVNTASAETRASLLRDGTRLYFGSNRPGSVANSVDIYMSTRSGPGKP